MEKVESFVCCVLPVDTQSSVRGLKEVVCCQYAALTWRANGK